MINFASVKNTCGLRTTLSLAFLSLLTITSAIASVGPQVVSAEQAITTAVRADYRNETRLAGGAAEGIEFHSGNVGEYQIPGSANPAVVPSSTNYRLASSGFGQPFGYDMVTPTFVEDAVNRAAELLYYDRAPEGQKESAAFRYLALLYATDGSDPLERVRAQFEEIENLYGAPERARASQAERLLRDALKYAPMSRELRHAYLDLLHDRAQAEMIIARNQRTDSIQARLEPRVPGTRVIDGEIQDYEMLMPFFDTALEPYRELMRDPMGVDVASFDPSASPGVPFGFHMFQVEQPTRSQCAASYLDQGVLTPVIGTGEALFVGYADLVLLFETLSDQSRSAADLARLYAFRATGSDLDDALALIDEQMSNTWALGVLLQGMFPALDPQPNDASGLEGAIASWQSGLTSLENTRLFIESDTNLLGFDESFLMLSQNFNSSTFDTFDSLSEFIESSSTAPLTRAIQLYNDAITAKDDYRGYQDQLALQHNRLFSNRDDRLAQVVGVRYGQPGFDTPELNVGSEIQLQFNSIEAARLTIRRASEEISILNDRVQIEIARRASEEAINGDIADVQIVYGDKRADVREIIGGINAAQAAANEIAAAADATSDGLFGFTAGAVHAANAVVQAGAETAKGFLEGDLEQLAAEEQSKITGLQDQLLDVESQARIQDMLLQMRTLNIDSLEASLLLQRELAILSGLYSEVDDILAQIDRESELLSDRYFADPVHRLRQEAAAVAAENSFRVAQRWAYFMVRALEFKWNQPFSHTFEGEGWDSNSVFRVRNATELQQLIAAMRDFDAQLTGTLIRDDYFDWFSVREDFFGWEAGQFYVDEVTGELVDGITRFRRELERLVDENDNVVILFNTVREIPGGNFFRGPRYNTSGQVISRGLYLDKIEWIKINLPGSHTIGLSTLAGQLSQGGTAFMRNAQVGMIDPLDPTHILNEYSAWSTRHWYTLGNNVWQFREALEVPVTMALSEDSRVPPSVSEINAFRQRSVAATDWRLTIPIEDLGESVLNISELDDIELYFFHRAVARP